jgi:Flp pilus assembly protein TadD
MLSRTLAAGLLVIVPGAVPGSAAGQTLPPTYEECLRAEDPASGIAACEDALASPALLQAEKARGYVTLARYQRQTGDLSAALASVDKAAEVAPNAPAIPAERAVILHLSGDLAGARAAHERAFALGPGSVAMFNNRAITMLALGDAAAAVADFDSALAIMADDPVVLANRATAKCRAGDVEGSVTDRLAALALDERGAGDLEVAMAASGFEGGLGATAGDASGALSQWTAAGCPDAAEPRFF